ncbi:MAG: ADP-ribosylglycohydrolase family protein [Chloroherpetonaceae bacterium]|nr:ADP-ribosylglycohydrolase family protein [Chloroherpetonaceae bacterium]MDW8436879.1 ADP-ribosylglycohydrolase family protein [Chloroherpetonaceae bacterium]
MSEKEKAFILGALVGDALGLPVHRKPHHIVRMYFKGVKGYTDEYYSTATPTGLRKGQNSKDVLPLLSRLPDANVIEAWTDLFFQTSENARLSLLFQTIAATGALNAETLADGVFGDSKAKILGSLALFPTDLVAEFDEAMTEKDAVDFALAMLLRNHEDFETTVLSTVNMGGLTTLTGAIVGGAMALLNGVSSIPAEWIAGLEHSSELLARLDSRATR